MAVSTLFALLLASCGVDGPPQPPKDRAPLQTGATINLSGTAKVGISGGNG